MRRASVETHANFTLYAVLATVCVLVLYELADSTSGNINGWLNHLTGLARLMEYRGPELHIREAARAILEFSRYLLMLRHLLSRRASVFSQDAWLEEPWQDASKSIKQQVFDHGLRLATTFEQCDVALKQGCPVSRAMELVDECNDIYDRLQTLHQKYISPVTAYDPELVPTPSDASRELPFSAALSLSITALGIQLGASQSAYRITSEIIEPTIDQEGANYESARVLVDHRSQSSNRQALARHIVREISCCLDQYPGAMGAARMVFCLDVAMKEFQPLDPDLERCKALSKRLSGRATIFDSMLQPASEIEKQEIANTERSLLEYRFAELELLANNMRSETQI